MTLERFRQVVTEQPLDLTRAALLYARALAYPELAVEQYEQRLDQIAAAAADRLAQAQQPPAEALVDFITAHEGLRGNQQEYNDPRNSFINEVLDRGLGIPVTLSVIYIAVARRLQLKAYGIGLPGHFIAGVDQMQPVLIDVFRGRRVSVDECRRIVQRITGYEGPLRPEWLQPAEGRDILLRMLNNLRLIYMQSEQWQTAERVLDHMEIVRPGRPELLRDKGLIAYGRQDFYRAARLLENYLEQAPDAADADVLRRTAGQALAVWARFN